MMLHLSSLAAWYTLRTNQSALAWGGAALRGR